MSSINKVILIGNLGAAPEVRHSPVGGQITSIRIATTEHWKDKASNEKREQTEWHRVVFFGKLAEIAGMYLTKGSQVFIEGRLRTRKWQSQDGQDKYTTEIVAEEMQMLGKRDVPTPGSDDRIRSSETGKTSSPMDAFDMDDVPF